MGSLLCCGQELWAHSKKLNHFISGSISVILFWHTRILWPTGLEMIVVVTNSFNLCIHTVKCKVALRTLLFQVMANAITKGSSIYNLLQRLWVNAGVNNTME